MADEQFIGQQIKRIELLIETTEHDLYHLPFDTLNYKLNDESWSILECIEHLNRYCRFYVPHFKKAFITNLHNSRPYLRGWLGEKLVKMAEPAYTKKQKTLRHMNPVNSCLTKAVLDEFIDHQNDLLNLLRRGDKIDLNRKAVPVEFFKLLKMKIGVALEFVISHQERHMQQALRAETLSVC